MLFGLITQHFRREVDAAIALHESDGAVDLALGVGKGLALFQGQELGDRVDLRPQLGGVGAHGLTPGLERGPAPGGKGGPGRGDGLFELFQRRDRGVGEHLARGWIEDPGERAARDGLAANGHAGLADCVCIHRLVLTHAFAAAFAAKDCWPLPNSISHWSRS